MDRIFVKIGSDSYDFHKLKTFWFIFTIITCLQLENAERTFNLEKKANKKELEVCSVYNILFLLLY